MIHHVVPWMTGNIGGGLNEAISLLPEDAWVCVRDGDTLFLTPQWGKRVEAVVEAHGRDFAVIGAMTNRLRSVEQLHEGKISDEGDIGAHIAIAESRWARHGATVRQVAGPIAGMLMLFSRKTWTRHPFAEKSMHFDKHFCASARLYGGKLGVAQGLYLFHLYRWGHSEPATYVDHLA